MKLPSSLIIVAAIFLFSCHRKTQIPIGLIVENSTLNIDTNSINKVLENYKNDSLKHKAALFLLSNLSNYYYYQGSALSQYSNYFSLIRRDRDHGEYYIKSFEKLYGSPNDSLRKLNFLENLNSDLMIKNIDYAFKMWNKHDENKPDFNTFCKYVLPYQVENSKMQNRQYMYNKLNSFVDLTKIKSLPIKERYRIIRPYLDTPLWILSNRIGDLPHFNIEDLIDNKVGSCRELTDMHLYALRAAGIPVAIDFVIQWPFRRQGHSWNVVFDKHGHPFAFDGIDNPLIKNLNNFHIKKGKVYRYVYQDVKESLFYHKLKTEPIPEVFNDPHIMDVSDLYFRSNTINIPVSKAPYPHTFLCLFDAYENWIPIAWGTLNGNIGTFKNIETNNIYLPVNALDNHFTPANYPVYLDNRGTVNILRPDLLERYTRIKLDSVTPSTPDQYLNNELSGAMIQGSNDSNFKIYDTLYTFNDVSNFIASWNEVSLKNFRSYKYIRFIANAPSTCRIGELEFYNEKNEKVSGLVIGNNDMKLKEDFSLAFDGNPLSTYSTKASSAWVGLKLNKSERLKKLRFSPPIGAHDGKVNPNNNYELLYWDKKWVSLSKGTFDKDKLIFNNVPKNCLYLTKNLSNNSNCRIFIIDNGKVVLF